MDIILYLTDLLKTRKTVGIAGLGTFYKKKSPGKYDADQHAFIPPSFTIAFTTTVEETEELANYISAERNITPQSALYFIEEFAERIQSQLADQQQVDLGDLGQLIQQDREINFIPAEQKNFGNDFYGLPAVADITAPQDETVEQEKLATIAEENKLEEENPGQETTEEIKDPIENDDQPIYEEIAETNQLIVEKAPVFEPPIIETSENEEVEEELIVSPEQIEEPYIEEEEQREGMGFWSKFLIVLALILAIGAIAYFINPSFFNQYIQRNQPASVQPFKLPPDSAKLKTDSNKVDSSATKAQPTTLKDSTVIDSTKTYYEVIGTSENTKAAADKYIARVAKRGIVAKHIQLSRLRFSVSLGTFTDSKPAQKFTDSMKVMLKNKGIYTLSIKPKKHTK